ncbi:50S ribosome-binding GTPase [Candidatus Micrarchaeota archaeon]|nr:50S ribosome-binding GTPase [Candidatus Micrarchaeota archaeon]
MNKNQNQQFRKVKRDTASGPRRFKAHPPRDLRTMGQRMMNDWQRLKDIIHGADLIIEVVDGRNINGTRIPLAEKFSGSKRLLIIVNKLDLIIGGAPKAVLPKGSLYVSAKNPNRDDRNIIIKAIMEKTHVRPIHAVLVGYPNVGKSTLINLLAKRAAAKVSAVAGTTKDLQWVNITDDLVISDYRGIFPEGENRDALIGKGALNVKGDPEYYAHKFAEKILRSQKLRKWLETYYDIDLAKANVKYSEDLLVLIATRRGFFIKGGIPNQMEASKSLLRSMMEAPEI